MSWEACVQLASASDPEDSVFAHLQTPDAAHLVIDPKADLLIVDHFDLTMIALPLQGTVVRVQALTRLAAIEVVARHPHATTHAINLRGQAAIEMELGLAETPTPQCKPGTSLLVRHWLSYKDIRWYLVSYESDGDGVTL